MACYGSALSFYVRLDLPRGLFPSGLPTNSPVPLRATRTTHLILLVVDDDKYTGPQM